MLSPLWYRFITLIIATLYHLYKTKIYLFLDWIKKITPKLFLLLLLISLSSLSVSRSNETDAEYSYIIFVSDSSGVFGTVLNNTGNTSLYPNMPYKVLKGQRILFDRKHSSQTNRFAITADIGKYNHFTSENQYHYRLTNNYLIVVN
jgi:hypothetical protein